MGNILNVKETYTTVEWQEREKYYIEEVAKLVLPPEPTTKDIMKLTADIDSLLSEAMLDFAYIKRKYQDIDMKLKLAEKETFAAIKLTPDESFVPQGSKLTENDVKGLVVKYLKTHPIGNMKIDIYTIYQSIEHRYIFMESVVKMLTEKKAAIIADNAMLKIESNINE